MANEPCKDDRLACWNDRWDEGQIGFHKTEVHHMLSKHVSKLTPNGKPNKIFLPLCGKSLDIKWLADQGFSVVGLEGVHKAIEQFFTEQNLEWVEVDAPQAGANGKLLKTEDDKIKLFCSDIMDFTPDAGGKFDSVWDRGSLVALAREDVPRYIQVIKNVLKPGGRILVEVMEYDVAIMDDLQEAPTRPPPPFPMYERELKALYEPECTVQMVDREGRKLQGKDIETVLYLIEKKQ